MTYPIRIWKQSSPCIRRRGGVGRRVWFYLSLCCCGCGCGWLPVATLVQALSLTTATTSQRNQVFLSSSTYHSARKEDDDDDAAATPSHLIELDPVLQQSMERWHHKTDDNDNNTTAALLQSGWREINRGVQIWRSCLVRGRLPEADDFAVDDSNTVRAAWPVEPALYTAIQRTMTALQLPRLVLGHPEIVNAVLLTLLRLVSEFSQQVHFDEEDKQDDDASDAHTKHAIDDNTDHSVNNNNPQLALDVIAENIVMATLMEEWGDYVQGAVQLDQLLGTAGHTRLLSDDSHNKGFGIHDGVWKHSGWKTLAQIQQEQLTNMPQLKQLLRDLGRRPSAEAWNSVGRFTPRRPDSQASIGALHDPLRYETVSGLTLSGSLTDMLPSEAVLLKGSSPALRRLFLAKKVQAKLLSYERSGWVDLPSVPTIPNKNHRKQRMPSAPGGPIVICLDTSWSMSGGLRETLSKAVVVASVSAAHRQQRDCWVVAFSSESNVMETGRLTPNDPQAIHRLLDFLQYSFGGGTDVTGALRHVMQTTIHGGHDNDDDNNHHSELAAADLLLVTDGEIPDPPVSEDTMEQLHRLRAFTGMKIHGLLIGKRESVPLSKLCTHTYDFLNDYDTLPFDVTERASAISTSNRMPTTYSALSCAVSTSRERPRKAHNLQLPSRWHSMGCSQVGKAGGGALQATCRNMDDSLRLHARRLEKKRRFPDDDNDDGLWEYTSSNDVMLVQNQASSKSPRMSSYDSYTKKLQECSQNVTSAVDLALQNSQWCAEILSTEKSAHGSCWAYKSQMELAIERMSENLVEREEEARLVVLGLVAKEHVLLLGKPGTGKSELGRRLSRICGGPFFQRLLTRFSTPEELFGPLSLQALENDEYRRCTEGFLPTASVAFLDEIFKANSAILNTLLTILNERLFDNGAGHRESCDIRCVVGASNEMPESDELDALYDRFLLRKEVLPLSDEGMIQVLKMSSPGLSLCDVDTQCDLVFQEGLDNVVSKISAAADDVILTDDACMLLRDLRKFLFEDLTVEVSDRRFIKAARLLKISAASHGRRRVDPLDCLLLQHVVWQLPDQREAIRDWLWEHITPGLGTTAQFRPLLNSLREQAMIVIRKTAGDVSGTMGAHPSSIRVIHSLVEETSTIVNLLEERTNSTQRHLELLRRAMDHLWLAPDEAKAAQQLLLPKAERLVDEIRVIHRNALGLQIVLQEDAGIDNDVRLSLMEDLWDDDAENVYFSDSELAMGMKEAKSKYDIEMFRKWKRAKKKLAKQ